jgi:hypothetical protein
LVIRKTEAVTPPETIQKLLEVSAHDLVLVGGQALAFWVDRYGLSHRDPKLPAISNDVDFLSGSAGDKQIVVRLAEAIGGQTVLPNKRALTALVGQAIVDLSEDEYVNVDVIHKLVGLDGDSVRKRAVQIAPIKGRSGFLVMHPLDVLHSRLANLHQLPDKQNDKGRMQLALAIDVGRAFLRSAAKEAQPAETAAGRSPIQGYVSAVERMATEDAGRKVADRHGLHVADAIDPHLIPPGPFWTKRWPGLKKLMSTQYSGTIRPPKASGPAKPS